MFIYFNKRLKKIPKNWARPAGPLDGPEWPYQWSRKLQPLAEVKKRPDKQSTFLGWWNINGIISLLAAVLMKMWGLESRFTHVTIILSCLHFQVATFLLPFIIDDIYDRGYWHPPWVPTTGYWQRGSSLLGLAPSVFFPFW